jgi:hypothetical protein
VAPLILPGRTSKGGGDGRKAQQRRNDKRFHFESPKTIFATDKIEFCSTPPGGVAQFEPD